MVYTEKIFNLFFIYSYVQERCCSLCVIGWATFQGPINNSTKLRVWSMTLLDQQCMADSRHHTLQAAPTHFFRVGYSLHCPHFIASLDKSKGACSVSIYDSFWIDDSYQRFLIIKLIDVILSSKHLISWRPQHLCNCCARCLECKRQQKTVWIAPSHWSMSNFHSSVWHWKQFMSNYSERSHNTKDCTHGKITSDLWDYMVQFQSQIICISHICSNFISKP